MDFAYLATQTFGDAALERELLDLFVGQVRRLVPTLPALPERKRADTAHLLTGSARGIGAWTAAAAAAAYEAAPPTAQPRAYSVLADAFADAEAAIEARLASAKVVNQG